MAPLVKKSPITLVMPTIVARTVRLTEVVCVSTPEGAGVTEITKVR